MADDYIATISDHVGKFPHLLLLLIGVLTPSPIEEEAWEDI